jgi:hypothetical protein
MFHFCDRIEAMRLSQEKNCMPEAEKTDQPAEQPLTLETMKIMMKTLNQAQFDKLSAKQKQELLSMISALRP